MKRRTMCQILLSAFGLTAKPDKEAKFLSKMREAVKQMEWKPPLPSMTNEMLDAMFNEMASICRSVIAAVDDDPAVVWRVHVQRHHMQHNLAVVYVDCEVRSNGVFECSTGHVEISIVEFTNLSTSEKNRLMESRLLYMELVPVFRRKIDADL